MTPIEFYTLAQRLLANEKCPAGFRSVTSRAYYAAFLEGVDFLAKMGVPVEKTASGHKHVQYILGESGDSGLVEAGGALDDLRDHRNGADYRIQEHEHEQEPWATLRLREAGDVMTALGNCRQSPARFEAVAIKIRRYASTILGIEILPRQS